MTSDALQLVITEVVSELGLLQPLNGRAYLSRADVVICRGHRGQLWVQLWMSVRVSWMWSSLKESLEMWGRQALLV